jgi:hypothetical protein
MKKAFSLILCLILCTLTVNAQTRTSQARRPSTGGTPPRQPQTVKRPQAVKNTGGGTPYKPFPTNTGGGTPYGAPWLVKKPSTGGTPPRRPQNTAGGTPPSRARTPNTGGGTPFRPTAKPNPKPARGRH